MRRGGARKGGEKREGIVILVELPVVFIMYH